MTKFEAMKAMEKQGLGFTANVIMNGCGKPATKMKTILALIGRGLIVSHAPMETCAVVVNGRFFWLGALDAGADEVYRLALGGKRCRPCGADHDPAECLNQALASPSDVTNGI